MGGAQGPPLSRNDYCSLMHVCIDQNLFDFWHERLAFQSVCFSGGQLAMRIVDTFSAILLLFFPFPPIFFFIVYFSLRRNAWMKRLILGPPSGHFEFFRWCGIASNAALRAVRCCRYCSSAAVTKCPWWHEAGISKKNIKHFNDSPMCQIASYILLPWTLEKGDNFKSGDMAQCAQYNFFL